MYNYFVLAYEGIEYFNKWYRGFNKTNLYIIDNGKQNIPSNLKDNLLYSTKKNIGCAGGWNLICDIAFKHYGLDRIIIGQEDARISEEIFEELYNKSDQYGIYGTYNNGFEFSNFIITSEYYNKIGRFDENFISATYEDNDYKFRSKLYGQEVLSLNISNEFNLSLSNREHLMDSDIRSHNKFYYQYKWLNETSKKPMLDQNKYKSNLRLKLLGDHSSETEYLKFKENLK